jgi:hypothetical protein
MKELALSLLLLVICCCHNLEPSLSNKMNKYTNEKLKISFEYPSDWGDVNFYDYSKLEPERKCYLLKAAGADYKLTFTNTQKLCHCGISFFFIRFDEQNPYRVICYEDDVYKTNLIEKKEEIAKKYKLKIDNHPAFVTDGFFEPGQENYREYQFFVKDYMVEINISIDNLSLKEKGYNKPGIDPLIPKNRSNETLNQFFEDISSFIISIKFN